MGSAITKTEVRSRLKNIAIRLAQEYKLEGLKTTRGIYREVSELYNEITDKEIIND